MSEEKDYELEEMYPKYIVNSNGSKKEFEDDSIARILNMETGINIKLAEQISEDVLRKLIIYNLDEITTTYIRELVCIELSKRGLNKYRNLFANTISLENFKFRLDNEFIEKYKGKQPDWGDLGYIVYKRTYARVIISENRREEFWETVRRVVEGCYTIQKEHCIKLSLPFSDSKAQKSARIMYDKIWNFKFIPPGRGLWMMGTEFIKRHGSFALNNCSFISTKDINIKYSKIFEFTMDALMLGVGVGFDTKGAGKIKIQKPKRNNVVAIFEIPDSREGWIEALKLRLETYFLGNDYYTFDFSKIRPSGSFIRGFGGIASGPKPLKEMLENIRKILEKRVGKYISSVDIVDIMNYIGKCVVAGGVRRSAQIALGDHDDLDFITCKQDEEKLYSHRWVSNNSIFAKKGMDYSFITDQIAVNGEPGVFWLNNARQYSRMKNKPDNKDKMIDGVNPCSEIGLESGELCNLSETFPSRHESYEEFKDTLKFAYLYAKSVTLINTHWKETNAVMLKNRRIGISQTGIIDAFILHGRSEMLKWCDNAYEYLRELDEKYSDWLCVPRSIKITTVKPSGSVSLLPGVSPGIHYPHSEYYIRRMRISKNSDLIDYIKEKGYKIEDDLYSPNTLVIEFPIHEKYFKRSKKDVSIWEQAENAASYQKYWTDNQVSITITFRKDEKDQIKYVLECYEDKLKSVSFLPINDHGYKQSPYEEITKEQYEEMVSKIDSKK